MLLLDTCALIFWTLDPGKLSESVSVVLKQEKDICISAISVWEVGIKEKRKKLILPLSFENYVRKLQKLKKFRIIPVDEHIWVKNIQLEWDHKDPADRTIVATALMNDCSLITSDKKILKFYKKGVW